MYTAYKLRIYPNNKQQIQINKTIGCCRYIYNYYLAKRIELYNSTKQNLTYNKCCKDLTTFKQQPEVNWLNEVPRNALDKSLENLDIAFGNFFREIKRGNKEYGFPKFKKKHDSKQSYRISNSYSGKTCHTPLIDIKNNKIKIPKLGWIKFVRSRDIIGKIISVTITKTPSNKYFASVLIDTIKEKLPENNNQIGIDLGVKIFGTTSDGEIIENPKILSKSEKRQKLLSRKLSRKQKKSKNYNKAKVKLARINEHIKNQRTDFLQKLSTKLIRENQTICLEDLDISEMLEKRKMSKSIQDVSLYYFRLMLDYKAKWYGRTIVYVDQYFPSSQLCSNCGYKNIKVKNLDVREWDCPQCSIHHNRDINAAINILNEGLKQAI